VPVNTTARAYAIGLVNASQNEVEIIEETPFVDSTVYAPNKATSPRSIRIVLLPYFGDAHAKINMIPIVTAI
jgi:hypothetical protein